MLSKIKTLLAYTLAFLGIAVALAVFLNTAGFAKSLIGATGLKISPWLNGGDIAKTISRDSYDTRIHKPVFDALIGQRAEGFVQIDFAPKESVPRHLREEIDYNQDGKADFVITWNLISDKAEIHALSPEVLGLQGGWELSKRYAIRVQLKNMNRQ